MAQLTFQQEPMAIVGFSCRLPGGNNSPQKLWEFLESGGVAPNTVPKSRFNIDGHYDGSHKPGTMRPPGGMFLSDDIDLAHFDTSFFETSGADAVGIDPNQRQLLEVVYEGLESAGITLEKLDGAPVACFVGSYSSDYHAMLNRDGEDSPPNFVAGTARAMLANRVSYFLNIKGPSVTVDTACSGSLVGLDLACRSLQMGEANLAIVAASNLFLNPEHVMDTGGMGQAHSPTALCHTFDADADGYVKAEAVNCLIVKKLVDAIRDRDPIRAVVRGTASNSNGRTVGGIVSPNSVAQATAIRTAYARAGISDFNETSYLECHGTGTPAGDAAEVNGAGSVFGVTRDSARPLLIGSIKSNLGHAEPAAGISGVIKVILSMEKNRIPGTPTFITPSPKIDFVGNKVKASRRAVAWPKQGYSVRRASVSSSGFGGSNAHAVIEQHEMVPGKTYAHSYQTGFPNGLEEDGDPNELPNVLVLSANDATALKASINALCNHLINPAIQTPMPDLAYTLSERRSRFFHRAFVTTTSSAVLDDGDFIVSKRLSHEPKIGFVFTGQGAQWPQMGRDLLKFPLARSILQELDEVLQAQPNPPTWTLLAELCEPRSVDHLRQPEFSQPLVTALQLCLVSLFRSWGIKPNAVVGHSSGEIAAAYAAGYLDLAGAIKAAFYRGRAAVNRKDDSEADVGMLAVGLGPEGVAPFMSRYSSSGRNIWIACFNSPSSVTISGNKPTLENLAADIKASGHFARLLHVDLAYHSPMMDVIGDEYSKLLASDDAFKPLSENTDSKVTMFSSVTASERETPTDAEYWKSNMVSPVRFAEALTQLVASESPDIIIELGPAGALAGPISQILKDKALESSRDVVYWASWARGAGAAKALLNAAGRLFNAGAPVDMCKVNGLDKDKMRIVVDLPSYPWNHTVRYWHENAASVDWRTKRYVSHDLIGSKISGTSWTAPTWRKQLRLSDVPWLRDHLLGSDVLLPGAAFAAMALEAMYQKHCALYPDETEHVAGANDLAYRFRNVKFERAVVVEDTKPTTVLLTLTAAPGSKDWHEFRVRTTADDVVYEHCWGLIRVQEPLVDDNETLRSVASAPLRHPQAAGLWYKRQDEIGTHFGPAFQKIKQLEAVSGRRDCRAALDLTAPPSRWDPQSYYPMHPAALDACFQSSIPAVVGGERSALREVLVPAQIDDMVINKMPRRLQDGMAAAEATWSGRGRKEKNQTWTASIVVRDAETGQLYVRVRGLANNKLDVQEKADAHVFQALHWKPDISLLSQDQMLYMAPSGADGTLLDDIIDLAAHKTPRLKVLEVAMDAASAVDPLWLHSSSSGIRAARVACSHYDFATSEAQTLVAVQSAHDGHARSFHLLHSNQEALGLPATGPTYDLAIVRGSTKTGHGIIDKIRSLLRPCGILLRVPDEAEMDSGNGSGSESGVQTPSSASGEALSTTSEGSGFLVDVSANAKARSADEIEEVAVPGIPAAWLSIKANTRTVAADAGPLLVLQFDDTTPPLAPGLRTVLTRAGWKIKTASISKLSDVSRTVAQAAAVLVVDEMATPVLANISERQWEALKQVASSMKPLVWVTKGSQTAQPVTDPDRALVHGLFRTFRREELGARLTTLDVQSAASPAAHRAIERVLNSTYSRPETSDDYEYVERDGVLLVPRLMVDNELNAFKAASGGTGLEPVTKGLHATQAPVRLRAEVVGSLQRLVWSETAVSDLPLADTSVEVEVMAVGANFKDVATAMGIVPENEYMLGFECSGTVRRVGAGAASRFRPGDRVVAHTNGSYANRVQCSADRVHGIPDSMSFEDAATIPVVYATVVYALFHLTHLREGQSILIHSAAGGVGIAAIQLAQYAKADIFVTVGTDEKRDLLITQFGIPPERIFSSRNIGFADAIRRATGGRGVDVVLNSLVGELLDESWRLTADGGTMVEIGKRDIVDRNTLAMEPFNRNCSFRAVDLSYTPDISDALIAKLLAQVFDLVNRGHIGPVHPVTTYGFDQVIEALSLMRSGKHMGKIVISSGLEDVQLPIRPAVRELELKSDATYLLVGGLKGACGSLAVHMARHGARHLVSLSRSGMGDRGSAKIVEHCASYGCEVIEAKGDVGDLEFVRGLFRSVQHGYIAGVIQGAMVTRDKPYELMTHDDYHTAIHAKVKGTWNIHLAAQQEQKQPFDFFSLLSSVSGVVGMKGQANYAAANAFLDAFAYYRQSQGLHANSIDLGVIEDVGFIAEMEGGDALAARFDEREWPPINEDMLRQILSYSILQQDDPRSPISYTSAAQLISGLAYPLPAGAALSDNPRFDYLFNASASSDASSGESASSDNVVDQTIRAFKVQHTSGSSDAALIKTALQILQSQVTMLLRLETEIEPGKPLLSYGLDSLSAVELRGWIRHRLGAELSTLDITNASSLVALCEKLVDKLPRVDADK
ncbi:hypothetical protein PTT_07049 [Pyrenophora teres f. teres 0-1]|uniref:Uncharacterized protein n=1 Tax=Pyrenophora teres f. teres (strain 0-1) TaxID=861557 RepID=E3RGU7_PYRTT|nr:hypothetical protein PTT_07049 [Pyrenophora teres f. teres 0-1]KAE8827865.1 hypothetical protein HRS9139_07084 [Pyrenophora teres f. teres]KAE8830460.1 hypothetical protein PTNB85_07047 [Pyrenophora teres f. teres]